MATPLASDLYLNENWNSYAGIEPDPNARRAKIFAAYIALGANGRWPYQQAAAQLSTPISLDPEAEVTRTPQERALAKVLCRHCIAPWVRTNYSANNLLAAQDEEGLGWATLATDERTTELAALDIESAFNGLCLEAVLQRVPELVDSYCRPVDPSVRTARLEETRSEVILDLEMLRNGEDDDNEYEEARYELLEGLHESYVTGRFWLQDEVADETHELRLVWIDEYGRLVRENRVADVREFAGLLMDRRDEVSRWWLEGESGAEYDPLPADYAAMFSEASDVS